MLIVAFLVIWIGGIGARLVYLQVQQHDWLRDKAQGQRLDVKKSKMPRGTIYDRDGHVLAISVSVRTLFADPTQIEDIPSAAHSIAKATGTKEKEVLKLLSDGKEAGRKFVPLMRGVEDDEAVKIDKQLDQKNVRKADKPNFTGLYWREEPQRRYPQESLAAHIVGFSDANGVGQAGIERSQNDILYGAVIKKVQERDRLGRVYDEQVSEKEPPRDIFLTIRNSIQYKTELPLAKAVQNSGAKAGIAIVIDHKTGEILAMANYPTFDPNKLNSITADNLMNRAVQSVYSPGSAFKLVTYGTALENRLITPDAMIDKGNGVIDVAGHVFTDHHGGGSVTATKALAQSSNICAIKTGLRVGKDNFYASMMKFGFGSPTGIELPAETKGIVRNPSRWNGDSLASMSIGYEIGVTALQMATAFATIANDGIRVQPHIIKEIRQFDEKSGSTAEPEKIRVVSEDTARGLTRMLEEVVLSGTGKRAKLDGYTAAGKTGTAWKFDEKLKRVNSAKYMSSFIGFAPAEDPRVTIAVIIDEPKVGGRDGGQVAAPVFHDIAEQVLPELDVRPSGITETLTADSNAGDDREPELDEIFPDMNRSGAAELRDTDPAEAPDSKAARPSKPDSDKKKETPQPEKTEKPVKPVREAKVEKKGEPQRERPPVRKDPAKTEERRKT